MATKCRQCSQEIWFKKNGYGGWVPMDPPDDDISEFFFSNLPLDKRHEKTHFETCPVMKEWDK